MFHALELVPLQAGAILHEAGGDVLYAYFPVDAIVSLLCLMDNGPSIEVAMAGPDGMIGVSPILDRESAIYRAAATTSGHAYRLKEHLLRSTVDRSPALRNLLLRYAHFLNTQMAQSAACNRFHTVDQHLQRWLLSALDRLGSDTVAVTQEQLSQLLGVRRESITDAARKLQAAGLIIYTRGRIRALNRARLEAQSCECYRVIKNEEARLLPA